MIRALLFAAAFTAALAPLDAGAQGVGVSPVFLELRPQQTATSVRIENNGATPRAFETDMRAWSQDDGRDVLTPTRAFIISPSVFEVAPGAMQIVRVARRPGEPQSASAEQSFRLLVRELLAEDAAPTQGLRLQLELSLPLFVHAAGAAPDLAARWTEAGLEIVNQGSAHARLAALLIDGERVASSPRYLLAGASFVRPASPGRDVRVRIAGEPADLVLDAAPRTRAR